MLCPKCKKEIDKNNKYCPECGSSLNSGSSFGVKKIAIGAAAVLVAVGCFAMFGSNKNVSVSAEAKAAAKVAHENGVKLYKSGKIQEAAQYFTDAIDKNPTQAKYYLNRSVCHFKLNNFKEGMADIDKAIECDPNCYAAYEKRGWYHFFEFKNYDLAAKDFSKLISAGKGNFDNHVLRGASYLHMMKTAEAKTDLKKAWTMIDSNTGNKDKAMVLKYFGDAYYQSSDYQQAIKYYTDALKCDPENILAEINRSKAERNSVAIKFDLSVLEVMPHNKLEPLVKLLEKESPRILKKYPNYDANDYTKLAKELEYELSLLAGNKIANEYLRKGKGVSYQEMVVDAARFLNADISKCKTVMDAELTLIKKFKDNKGEYSDSLAGYSGFGKILNAIDRFQKNDLATAALGTVLDLSTPAHAATVPITMRLIGARWEMLLDQVKID